jgi:hypothetical protein
MIARVREMLRFQAKAVTLVYRRARSSVIVPSRKFRRVKLHSRLGGQTSALVRGGFVHQGGRE